MHIHRSLEVGQADRVILESWLRSGKTESRYCERARIILSLHQGRSNKEVAEELATREARVSKWRSRYESNGIAGLQDQPRSGKPAKYHNRDEERILQELDKPAPKGYGKWNGRLLAERLEGISKDQVWKVLRKHKIHLQRNHSWCISTDPEFARKAADIVGLYLHPDNRAVVICVDEKPSIQALSREQGWLRLPDGKAITGYSHEYIRNGTITLFAALEVATGLVKGKFYKRKRRREFLDFMNEVVANYPKGQQLHVVLDNLSTHKPRNDKWLQRHKNVHFYYTPTHASWLNMVEIWFSLLSRHALKGQSFQSVKELVRAIETYMEVYNEAPHPFEWTKEKVYPKTLKPNLR
ncbi:MAG TPA: IS630 family transposase [Puia sp.]|nr:IS630 family transposase [Puia sp.]